MVDEQGIPVFPSVIPPETAGMTDLISPRPYSTPDSSSQSLTSTPPSRPSSSYSSASDAPPRNIGPAPPHSHSTKDTVARRPSLDRAASERLPAPLRVSLAGKRATTSEMPSHLDVDHPFFYECSPSESDTSTSSSDDEDAPPTGNKLRRRPTDTSLERAPDPNANRHPRSSVGDQYFKTKGKVSKLDGRLKISVKETANRGFLAKALGRNREDDARSLASEEDQKPAANTQETIKCAKLGVDGDFKVPKQIPKLNIVIMVIGSRGDIQPFLKVGKILQNDHGHRVRIATHPAFKEFVEKDCGLEFFSVGGDPSELMAFMVKNPGLIPSLETVKAGEIGKRRKSMWEMFNGMWRACINTTDDETDKQNIKMS